MSKKKRRKKNRRRRHESGFDKRSGRKNRHHDFARSRGTDNSLQNIIMMDTRRHAAFHLLFGNRTFVEAASLLMRVSRAKHNQSGGG